mmetsp:Transcript_33833/g.60448  ORF Transcript_33833/g.60448 Transcript_33833/m.60448 type:complete len:286 (-) Transcript_33833:146-1003(-)|eukprot:CAMPEP_0177791668 /NCGR_PEP_ID=MMETSP0491_2-20121128/24068_1 /TAXON_ID=63592 /ORGANISM="Tetraselmis chuii, Strain PLY429" /LENGTH=285 /DNA_ID=CAMNT_0019313939 /DNA_START=166 /DNA_END=1023 /DNA_ORIENTATION=+
MAAAAATRGVTIAFAGAAGAALFSYAETVSELAREVSRTVVHTLSKPKGSGQDDSSDGGTVALLTQQIDQLSKELRRIAGGQGREVRIVHEGGATTGARIIQLGVVAGGGYVYMRLRGYNFSDFMYVTRASLTKSIDGVSQGIDMLKGRLQGIRAHMQQQLDSLTRKHDESTAEIKEQITSDISLVQSQIAELGSAQGYANQGIYLLSRAVAELTGNANSKAVRELEAFTRTRPSVTYAYQSNGLRSVMGLTDGEDGQSGVVAQRTSFNSNGSTSNASNGLNDLL